ncbi:MAG: FAD-dependent oxidoreductase [Flavobacteriales bacterium]|jgi:glycine/D-amino acid oxidase-like deaminating enzyme|tara:strand:- start:110 stop:1246 length:1137 start_codon:yes stop_codon:yes gene_type:complete
MHVSFWEQESFYNNIDYAIVGSGIVGLSAAIELRNKFPTAKVVVLEKGFLPSGASTKNAGFTCFGSPTETLDDLSIMSENEVFNIVKKRWDGLLNLRRLLGEENLGFEQLGSCELFTKDDENIYIKTVEKLDYLNNFLKPIFKENVFLCKDELISEFGFKNIAHVIYNKFEGQIDTGKTMKSLLKLAQEKGVEIINGVNVKSVEPNNNKVVIGLEDFEIESANVIIATNGFAKHLLPELNVEPARAQVLITKPIEGLKLKGTFHYEQGYYYFRNVGNRVLFGGGRNLDFETENTSEFKLTPIIQNKLDQLLNEVILPYKKDVEVEMRWVGIMGVGNKKTTIVKQLENNIYCAVRMGGMGVAIGSLIGKEVVELLDNKE